MAVQASAPRRLLVLLTALLTLGALPGPAAAQEDSSPQKTDEQQTDGQKESDEGSEETETQPAPAGPSVTPDRPGFTDGSAIIAPGHLQLEAGANVATFGGGATFTPINLLGRYGISQLLELRLSMTPVQVTTGLPDGADSQGLTNVGVGAKLGGAVNEELSLAVLPFVDFNGLADDFNVSGGLNGIADLIAPESPLSLTLNLAAANVETNEGDRGFQVSGGLTAAAAITDAFGTYLELYYTVPPVADTELIFDGGVTYAPTNRLQLDAWLGVELPDADSVLAGLGASYLF